jgi:hypothetical protein
MLDNYERMFGEKPRLNVYSPLEKGDHPETDDSKILDERGTQQYQSIIGSLQWSISLGRLDICTAVMTLSGFRSLPRRGHLDRAKRVCCYLAQMKQSIIRFRMEEPDYSDLPTQDYDWERSVYGNVTEDIPSDAPEPLGKFVTLTHYVDANLYHCMLTDRSVTGVVHLLNQCPIDWFSKKQATVERRDCYIRFRVCRSSHLHRTDHGSSLHPQIPGCAHTRQEYYVWQQQISCQQFHQDSRQASQTPHGAFIPPCPRSRCCQNCWFLPHRRKEKPGRCTQQTLGIRLSMALLATSPLLERRYRKHWNSYCTRSLNNMGSNRS